MSLTDSTRSLLSWLRADTLPGATNTHLPHRSPSALLVLERSRLTEAEVDVVADAALRHRPVDRTAIGVEITRVLDVLPHPEDVELVSEFLATGSRHRAA